MLSCIIDGADYSEKRRLGRHMLSIPIKLCKSVSSAFHKHMSSLTCCRYLSNLSLGGGVLGISGCRLTAPELSLSPLGTLWSATSLVTGCSYGR